MNEKVLVQKNWGITEVVADKIPAFMIVYRVENKYNILYHLN